MHRGPGAGLALNYFRPSGKDFHTGPLLSYIPTPRQGQGAEVALAGQVVNRGLRQCWWGGFGCGGWGVWTREVLDGGANVEHRGGPELADGALAHHWCCVCIEPAQDGSREPMVLPFSQ